MINQQLVNASKYLFNALDIVNQSAEALEAKMGKAKASLAGLDAKSPVYDLQKRSLDEIVLKAKNEMKNLESIISSFHEQLKVTTPRVSTLRNSMKIVEREQEWAKANSLKRIYLSAARPFQAIADFLTSEQTEERKLDQRVVSVLLLVSGFFLGRKL